MVYSIIKKSQLEGARRLDAEYYQPEYLESQNALSRLSTKKLSEVCKISDGNHLTISDSFIDEGVRYLRGKDLNDFFISDDDPIYIPQNEYIKLGRSHILKDDVLLSIVGTVGMVSIVADSFDKLTGSCKIAILRSYRINPWFLSGFLSSRYGQHQIQRKVAGAVQMGIILKDLSEIVIPQFDYSDQTVVKEIIQRAYKKRIESETFYSQAEQILLEELGLQDFESKDRLYSVVKFSEIKKLGRMDAEYFEPHYKDIEKILKKFPQKRLEDICPLISYGTVPTSPYTEEGVPYVKGTNLKNCFISHEKLDHLDNDSTKSLPRKVYLKKNDIIISQMGTVGRAAAVEESEEGWLFASFTIRARLSEKALDILDPVYVALFINNVARPYYLLRRVAQASVRQNTDLPTIRDLKVPVLPKPTQQKIADLVRQSHEARKKAKELLEEAKRVVERLIEKGEN